MNLQPNTRWSVLLISLSMVIIMIAAAGVLRSQERLIRDQIASELASIARLKINQIADWRRERIGEGAEVMERPLFRALLLNWLSDPQQVDETILFAELRGLQRYDDYSDILIVDLSGKILISVNQIEGEVDGRNALQEAIEGSRPVLTELHIGAYNSEPHISTLVPILGSEGKPVGALALVTDVRKYLFPLIQSWPTESQTAETMLVRRDGNDVLVLNDLRHQADAALRLRIPLTDATLPSTMVVQGIQGTIEATDYRGVDVIAHLQTIPDSDWYIVTKVDQSEALAGWSQRVAITTMLSLSAALLISLIALLLWQSQRRKHVEQLYAAEKEQHARDLRYRTIVQSIGDGVIATDAQGNVTMLNPVAEMLTGWSDEEARGKPLETVFTIINEESRQPVVNPVTRVLQKGRIVGLANHTLLIDRNGVERPIADAAAPIRERDGEIQGVVLIFRDQSAERAAQRSLAESEARNRAMIAAIPDLIFQLDREYRFVDCWVDDPARLLKPMEEFLGKRTYDILPADVANGGARAVDRALATGTMQFFEYALDTPEGRGWFEQRIAPISADQVIAITRDISDRKRSELAIQVRLTLHEYSIDHTLGELLTKTLDEICELVSSPIGFYHFVEADQRTLSLQAWSTRTEREFCNVEGPWMHHHIDQAGVWADAVRLRKPVVHNDYPSLPNRKEMPEGHARLERELVVPILRSAQVVCILGVGNKSIPYTDEDVRLVSYIADVAWEIAERKRIEESQKLLQEKLIQSQKIEAVGQLAGGIAHDFNNMLAVILMRCEMALQQVEPHSPLHRHLTEIHTTGLRSAELTRQLLGFARKQVISPRVLDLNETLESLLSMLERLIGEDIELKWRPGPAVWPVKMDPSQISQIMVNLCVNARDAINGVGSITIRTENSAFDARYAGETIEATPGDYVLLTISDNGSGMSKEVLAHLFEPFFTTKEVGKGTGLGLATVYGIVQQNHGHIRVYSEVGLGTTFKIYLPRHFDSLEPTPETAPDEIPQGKGERVLLVEDEPAVLAMTAESLQKLGYTVLSAATSADALAIASEYEDEIDLLITDVVMPELNGRRLAERIAVHRPHIKRIFMSGYPADIVSQRAVFSGDEHFLSKPFTLLQLAVAVRKALDADDR